MTDAFGAAVDYPASIFTVPAPPPPRGTGRSLVSEDGSARFMMYAERNDSHLTPEKYILRNLAGPQSQLEYRRVSDRFFAVSGTTSNDIFYSRCNFPEGAAGEYSLHLPLLPQERKAGVGWHSNQNEPFASAANVRLPKIFAVGTIRPFVMSERSCLRPAGNVEGA